MHLDELQKSVDLWIKTLGVRYFNELTNTVLLTEEVGELASLMAREYGEQSYKNKIDSLDAKEKIKDEIGDILFVLTCLSNQMGINLEDCIKSNLEKKTKRDKNRHKENKKLQ